MNSPANRSCRPSWVRWATVLGLGLALALAVPPAWLGSVAAAAEREDARPSRVGFWRLPSKLKRALALALRSWNTELVRVPAPAKASRYAEESAAQLCQDLELEALVWARREGNQDHLHLYDARTGAFSERAIAARPSAATAAALALSLKSILRVTPDADEPPEPPEPPEPDVIPEPSLPSVPSSADSSVADRARRLLERKAKEDAAAPETPQRRPEQRSPKPKQASSTESQEPTPSGLPVARKPREVALETAPEQPRAPPEPIFATWLVLGRVTLQRDDFEELNTVLAVGGGRAWRQGRNRTWLNLEARVALPRSIDQPRFNGTVNSAAGVFGGGYARAIGSLLSLGLSARAGVRGTSISGQAAGINAVTRSTKTAFTLELSPQLALGGGRFSVFLEPLIEFSLPRRRYVVNQEPVTEPRDFALGVGLGAQWKL